MNTSIAILVGIANTIILTLITALGPSTNRFRTIPVAWRAVIVAVLSIASGGLEHVLNDGSTWQAAFLTAVASGIGGLVKVLIEALDSSPVASSTIRSSSARIVSVLLLALAGIGCGGRFEEAKMAGRAYRATGATTAPDGVTCIQLDDSRLFWSGTAKVAATLAGAQGIAILPIPYANDGARFALAAGVLGATSIAVFAAVASDGKAAQWARYCSDTGGAR